MGESFGIYSLKGYTLDIAMPQSRQGIDPFMGAKQAARRRDLTINALMQDVLTEETLDFFGGQEDLAGGVIRHVDDETFAEDPLRVLRAAQFAARFQFSVAPQTINLCSKLRLDALARERIEGEVQKALLKSPRPSVFFEELRKMKQLDCWFPELKALCGIPQNPRFHAEGDVWTHTMMVVDQAAQYRNEVQNPFAFMLAAVVHDFGKAVCTETIGGVIHAYGRQNRVRSGRRQKQYRSRGNKRLCVEVCGQECRFRAEGKGRLRRFRG
jgi:tRNA nucleotidyltransferase (CCA-adding enzyme)